MILADIVLLRSAFGRFLGTSGFIFDFIVQIKLVTRDYTGKNTKCANHLNNMSKRKSFR